jgi:hypothetical protein
MQFFCSFIVATMVFTFKPALPLLRSSFPVVLGERGATHGERN